MDTMIRNTTDIASQPRILRDKPIKIEAHNVDVYYGDKHAIKDLSIDIPDCAVSAFIGPSGCGKSTFLRSINRMNDTIPSRRVTGKITIDGRDIYDRDLDVVQLRARIGMVFQKPNPFPKSIFDNVAYGPKIHGLARSKTDLEEIVVTSLKKAGLFEEVKDRLDNPGTGLSGGQQQRLCIARAISVNPQVILMDEPCSALDPIATARIEELIDELGRITASSSSPIRCSRRRACRSSRLSSTRASWSKRATRMTSSPLRKISAPRITSPAGSARG